MIDPLLRSAEPALSSSPRFEAHLSGDMSAQNMWLLSKLTGKAAPPTHRHINDTLYIYNPGEDATRVLLNEYGSRLAI